MNYEEEAESLGNAVDGGPGDEVIAAWLRQHDARLLIEAACDIVKDSALGELKRIEVSHWLERRAREIESEIGEKP